jgi:hypothetical protein
MPEDPKKDPEPEGYDDSDDEEGVDDGVVHGRLSALLPRCAAGAAARRAGLGRSACGAIARVVVAPRPPRPARRRRRRRAGSCLETTRP